MQRPYTTKELADGAVDTFKAKVDMLLDLSKEYSKAVLKFGADHPDTKLALHRALDVRASVVDYYARHVPALLETNRNSLVLRQLENRLNGPSSMSFNGGFQSSVRTQRIVIAGEEQEKKKAEEDKKRKDSADNLRRLLSRPTEGTRLQQDADYEQPRGRSPLKRPPPIDTDYEDDASDSATAPMSAVSSQYFSRSTHTSAPTSAVLREPRVTAAEINAREQPAPAGADAPAAAPVVTFAEDVNDEPKAKPKSKSKAKAKAKPKKKHNIKSMSAQKSSAAATAGYYVFEFLTSQDYHQALFFTAEFVRENMSQHPDGFWYLNKGVEHFVTLKQLGSDKDGRTRSLFWLTEKSKLKLHYTPGQSTQFESMADIRLRVRMHTSITKVGCVGKMLLDLKAYSVSRYKRFDHPGWCDHIIDQVLKKHDLTLEKTKEGVGYDVMRDMIETFRRNVFKWYPDFDNRAAFDYHGFGDDVDGCNDTSHSVVIKVCYRTVKVSEDGVEGHAFVVTGDDKKDIASAEELAAVRTSMPPNYQFCPTYETNTVQESLESAYKYLLDDTLPAGSMSVVCCRHSMHDFLTEFVETYPDFHETKTRGTYTFSKDMKKFRFRVSRTDNDFVVDFIRNSQSVRIASMGYCLDKDLVNLDETAPAHNNDANDDFSKSFALLCNENTKSTYHLDPEYRHGPTITRNFCEEDVPESAGWEWDIKKAFLRSLSLISAVPVVLGPVVKLEEPIKFARYGSEQSKKAEAKLLEIFGGKDLRQPPFGLFVQIVRHSRIPSADKIWNEYEYVYAVDATLRTASAVGANIIVHGVFPVEYVSLSTTQRQAVKDIWTRAGADVSKRPSKLAYCASLGIMGRTQTKRQIVDFAPRTGEYNYNVGGHSCLLFDHITNFVDGWAYIKDACVFEPLRLFWLNMLHATEHPDSSLHGLKPIEILTDSMVFEHEPEITPEMEEAVARMFVGAHGSILGAGNPCTDLMALKERPGGKPTLINRVLRVRDDGRNKFAEPLDGFDPEMRAELEDQRLTEAVKYPYDYRYFDHDLEMQELLKHTYRTVSDSTDAGMPTDVDPDGEYHIMAKYAGAGKTYRAKQLINRVPGRCLCLAPTWRLARDIGEDQPDWIVATTQSCILPHLKKTEVACVLIDEVYMLSMRTLMRLRNIIGKFRTPKRKIMIIYAGDPHQLKPIDGGRVIPTSYFTHTNLLASEHILLNTSMRIPLNYMEHLYTLNTNPPRDLAELNAFLDKLTAMGDSYITTVPKEVPEELVRIEFTRSNAYSLPGCDRAELLDKWWRVNDGDCRVGSTPTLICGPTLHDYGYVAWPVDINEFDARVISAGNTTYTVYVHKKDHYQIQARDAIYWCEGAITGRTKIKGGDFTRGIVHTRGTFTLSEQDVLDTMNEITQERKSTDLQEVVVPNAGSLLIEHGGNLVFARSFGVRGLGNNSEYSVQGSVTRKAWSVVPATFTGKTHPSVAGGYVLGAKVDTLLLEICTPSHPGMTFFVRPSECVATLSFTGHSSQGLTFDSYVHVVIPNDWTRRIDWLYTALTRCKTMNEDNQVVITFG